MGKQCLPCQPDAEATRTRNSARTCQCTKKRRTPKALRGGCGCIIDCSPRNQSPQASHRSKPIRRHLGKATQQRMSTLCSESLWCANPSLVKNPLSVSEPRSTPIVAGLPLCRTVCPTADCHSQQLLNSPKVRNIVIGKAADSSQFWGIHPDTGKIVISQRHTFIV